MEKQTIIFIHLPKTGGQTLRKVVEQNYIGGDVFRCYPTNPNYPNLEDLKNLSQKEKEKIKVLIGHIDYGVHKYVREGKSNYVAMMRDPIDRVISSYQHVMINNKYVRNNCASILKLYETKRIFLDNLQTRMISGINPDFGKCYDEMLDRAIENIEKHFLMVGLNEHYDETLRRFAKLLGWESIEYERVNVTPNKLTRKCFSSIEIKKIKQNNHLDLQLYSYVKKAFTG